MPVRATPVGPPSVPVVPVLFVEETTVTLTWNAPLDTGGSPILTYFIYRYKNGSLIGEVPTNEMKFIDPNLQRGSEITYRISAMNGIGEGNLSGFITAYIDLGPIPSEPLNVTLESTNDRILLTWSPPSETGDGEILGYNIYRMMENISDLILLTDVDDTRFLDRNIQPNRTYIYRISAFNENGEGILSDEVSIYVQDEIEIPGNTTNGKTFPWWIIALLIPIILLVTGGVIFLYLFFQGKKNNAFESEKEKDIEIRNRSKTLSFSPLDRSEPPIENEDHLRKI